MLPDAYVIQSVLYHEEEVDAGHLDRDVFDLFMREKLYGKLDEIKAQMALNPNSPPRP